MKVNTNGKGKGIGMTSLSLQDLQRQLQHHPDSIVWSDPREVILYKGKSGKLGLKLQTYQGKVNSYTLIAKVKGDCRLQRGILNVFDRIVSVNNHSVVTQSGDTIINTLQNLPESNIVLEVSYPSLISNQLNKKYRNTQSVDDVVHHGKVSQSNIVINSGRHLTALNQNCFTLSLTPALCTPAETVTGLQTDCHKAVTLETDTQDVNASVVTLRSNEEVHFGTKRGHSEVSASSSNQSENSASSVKEEKMRKSKGDNKSRPKLKPGIDGRDHAELEPLTHHLGDSLSPGSVGRSDRLSTIQLEGSRSPSVPIRETTVSMQDIMFEDHAHSLPIGHMANCQCPSCTGATDSRVCYSCGSKPTLGSKNTTSPGVSLFLESKEPLTEDYANFLLKNPHLAVWDGKNTHVVEIDKGTAKEFGFSYKVKVGENQDASVEVYTLVKSVEKGGPAMGKLHMGDWIRSINGTPIQSPKEAFSLINSCIASRTLRLLIQRPVGFSQHPNSIRTAKSDSYVETDSLPSVQTIPSPNVKELDPLIPGIVELKKTSEKTVRQQNIYFSDMSLGNNESGGGSLPFPKTVKFPKVRIFICGNEAEKCLLLILQNSDVKIINQSGVYSYVKFSMSADCFGNVLVARMCSNLYAASCHSVSNSSEVCESSQRGTNESKCRNCGVDYNSHDTQSVHGTHVNVEMFAVPDDRFFHSCCHYLFTKSSLFILTFDGERVLSSPSHEFSRLQNLSHTIRSFAGEECFITTCGLLESGLEANNSVDEVRALFYTPLNTQLINFNVLGPELLNICTSQSGGGNAKHSHELQTLLWKNITDAIQRQHVLQPALLMVDYLNSLQDKDVILTEEQFLSVIKAKLPDYQLDVHQVILIYLNTCGEIILGKAAPYFSQSLYSIGGHVILKPELLLERLHHAVCMLSDDRQTWSRTYCTGFIKAQELLEIMALGTDKIHQKYMTEFLQCIGLVFCKPKLNAQMDMEFFLPYFAQVPSSGDIPLAGKKDLELYLQFADHESYQTFYQVVFMLVSKSDNVDSLTICASNCATFTYQGIHVTAFHEKIKDRIKFIFRKEEKSADVRAQDLYSWMYSACDRYLEMHFSLCAPCPLGDGCQRGSGGTAHLVDLRHSKPVYCGEDRIDVLKPVKQWKVKEVEHLSLPVEGLSSKPASKMAKPPVRVMELPWSVFNKLCQKLKVASALGRDWKGLADLMGYTTEEVAMYEAATDPVRQLMCHWCNTNHATIDQLISLLKELERLDIVSDLQAALSSSPSSPPTLSVSGHAEKESLYTNTGSNITLCEMGMPQTVIACETLYLRKGQITVGDSSVTNVNIEEGNRLKPSIGVKLNNLDNNNQVDVVSGIGTEVMITPVETPRRSGCIN